MNSRAHHKGHGKKKHSHYQNKYEFNQKKASHSSNQYPSNQSELSSNKRTNERENTTTKVLPFDFDLKKKFSRNEPHKNNDNYNNNKACFSNNNKKFQSGTPVNTITNFAINSISPSTIPPPPLPPLELFSSNVPPPPLPPSILPLTCFNIMASNTMQTESKNTQAELKNSLTEQTFSTSDIISDFMSSCTRNVSKFDQNLNLKQNIPSTSSYNNRTHKSNKNEVDFVQFECKNCTLKFDTLKDCLAHELVAHFSAKQQQLPSISNEKLSFKRKKKLKSLLKPSSEADNSARNELEGNLCKLTDESSILQQFRQIFQPQPNILNRSFERIYDDLQYELSKQGQWIIRPFGSSVNAMALKTSDMDFYINRIQTSNKTYGFKSLFYQVRDILVISTNFSNVIAVPRARIPVIKCKHIHTGYNLDINLTSITGVHNSKFIANAIQFDPRIHSLLLLIKVWAYRWELTKTGRMTNYCLTLLVFFYLQSCSPPVLPTVKEFQENCEPFIVDGFNFAYQIPKNFQRLNRENVFNLLKGFFEFYLKFDFQINIISPYLGKAILKFQFTRKRLEFPEYEKQVEQIKQNMQNMAISARLDTWKRINNISVGDDNPNEMHHLELKVNSPICVQDPFCLTMNKFNSGPNIFAHFIERIRIASIILHEESDINFSDYIVRLLYDTIILNPVTPPPEPIKKIKSKNNCVCQLNPLDSELTYLKIYLKEVSPNKNYSEIEYKKIWSEKLKMFLIEIFESIFKITVRKKSNLENVTKSPKLHKQSDVHTNQQIEYYTLESLLDLWSCRKSANIKGEWKKFLMDSIAITEKLLSLRKDEKKFQVKLNCELKILTEFNYSCIRIELLNLEEDNKNSLMTMKLLFNEISTKIRNIIIAYFHKLQLRKT